MRVACFEISVKNLNASTVIQATIEKSSENLFSLTHNFEKFIERVSFKHILSTKTVTMHFSNNKKIIEFKRLTRVGKF